MGPRAGKATDRVRCGQRTGLQSDGWLVKHIRYDDARFSSTYIVQPFYDIWKNVPRGYVSDPIQWRPREWNCAADLLANVGLQSPHELVHMDMSRIGPASFLQCHSDGGFIPADGTGSWGFTVCIWQHTEQLGWTRDLVGYGHGRFEGCKHSLHAELVALDRLLQTLRPFVV